MFAKAFESVSQRVPCLTAACVLAFGLACTSVGTLWLSRYNAKVATAQFDERVEELSAEVQGRLAHYELMLRGARGAVVAVGERNLTREAFHAYSLTRDLGREFPGARGFGFVRRVMPENEADFLRRARLDGAPDFQIRQIAPHPGERDVIQYVEPIASNREALGLDAASEDRRREAAWQAMETGVATLTAPVTLVQATGMTERGGLLFLPIQRLTMPVETPDQRRAATYGWTYAPLVIDEVLAGLNLGGDALGIAISDRTPTATTRFFTTFTDQEAGNPELSRVAAIQVFNRAWDVEVRARPKFVDGLHLVSPGLIAALGAALSVLIATVAYLRLAGRQRQVLADRAKSRLAAIVQTAGDAIIGKTVNGLVTDWNPAAEHLFGYTAQEAFGASFAELVIPPHLRFEEAETLACIRRGEAAPSRSTLRRHRDGTLIAVMASAAPIRAEDGRVIGIASTLRDIRDQVAADERIRALNADLERQVADRTAELTATSALQSAILTHAGYAVIATDLEGTITLFNPAAERMLGYDAAVMVGRATPAVFHDANEVVARANKLSSELGERIEPGFDVFVARTRHGLPNVDEWTYITRDGTRLPVRLNVSALRADDGRNLGYLGIALDLTERHRHEDEMRAANAGTWNYDVVTGRVWMSSECARQHGLGDREVEIDVETGWKPLAHPDDVAKVLDDLQTSVLNGGSYTTEFRILLPNGKIRWITAMGRTEADASGTVTRVIGLTLDITAQKDAERALRESEQRYRLLAENTVEMIVQTDMSAVRRYVSPACRRILGYEPEELLGRKPQEIVHPDDLAEVNAIIRDLSEGRTQAAVKRQRYRRRDGSYVWVEVSYQLYHDADGQPLGCMACTRDISEQQAHAEALQEARAVAERASHAKTDFLAAMSHEIRTPLNAIIGFTDLMIRSSRLDPDNQRQAELVHSSGQALLTIVNDILDFSKVEAGAIELQPRAFSPRALADNCLSIVQGLAEPKGLSVRAIVEPDLPAALLGDENRLRQVLLNLLNNAVKFTRAGSITLVVRHEGQTLGGEQLRFSVIDTGIGIPPEKQPRLFQRFSQVDGSIERDFGGTGLGLAICKSLIGLMDGEIGVASRVGRGSTFWFTVTLPATVMPVAPVASATTSQRRVGHLLLVEDSEINQVLARTVLEQAGHRVDVVGDGAAAVMAVDEGTYDLVLMDVQMPGMDGITATRLIRRLKTTSASVPILAMTANVLTGQIQTFTDAGMNDHVGKPFERDALLATIERWLTPEAPALDAKLADPRSALDQDAFDKVLQALGPAKLESLLELLIREMSQTLEGPFGTITERDTIRQKAHSLTAATGALGFIGLSAACRSLDACREAEIAAHGVDAFAARLAETQMLCSAATICAQELIADLQSEPRLQSVR